MLKDVLYRMVLDFDRPCPKCRREATILITSSHPDLPSFHFCGCESPTFTLTQDGVGEVPSFARVTPGTQHRREIMKVKFEDFQIKMELEEVIALAKLLDRMSIMSMMKFNVDEEEAHLLQKCRVHCRLLFHQRITRRRWA
jgi:hypothetical protein